MFYSEIYQPGVADFDHGGKFGYEAILRIFENTASRHSDSSGDDIIAESRNGITWVLTDWRVQIVRRPDSKAPLRVTTWVRDSVPTGRIFRDYTLADETGAELVCAESRLVLFDLRAQKIIRIDQTRFRSYRPEARGVFASAAPRLRAPDTFDGRKRCPCAAATSILTATYITRSISTSRSRPCRIPCRATRSRAFAWSTRRRSRMWRPSRSNTP